MDISSKQNGKISHEKTWTLLQKENLLRDTDPLLLAAQNKAIRTEKTEGDGDTNFDYST